jgi:hypothetical protein
VLVRVKPDVIGSKAEEVIDSAVFVEATTAVDADGLVHPVSMTIRKIRESNFLSISFVLSPQR